MIDFFRSRKGSPAASFNGVLIHSRYDPVREAERFLAEHLLPETNGSVIIFGAGLGYIASALKRKSPGRKIISVNYHYELYKRSPPTDAPAWHPESKSSILGFFSACLDEDDAQDLTVLEWPPCIKLFPELHHAGLSALKTILERLNGNIVTTSYFGRKWLRNSIRNFILLDKYVVPVKTQLPVIIAASGPTLEESISLIKKFRSSVMLVSVPSALRFLLRNNCRPDTVICTDPGYWTRLHIEYMNQHSTSYCTMPLSAAGEVYRNDVPIALLVEDKPWETALLSGTGISRLYIPENGTVSGSALEFALAVSSGPVFFAGLDFSYSDIRGHVNPNGFDGYLNKNRTRLSPEYSVRYLRALKQAPERRNYLRTSRPLDTYRDWFSARVAAENRKIFRLAPTPLPCLIPAADSQTLESYAGGGRPLKLQNVPVPRTEVRKRKCSEVLAALLLRSRELLRSPYADGRYPNIPRSSQAKGSSEKKEIHRFLRTIDTPAYIAFLRALRTNEGVREKAETLLYGVENTITEIKERIS